MINIQELRQQIQNQLQINFESNQFYYQNQNPQIPNGFTPVDQINNFDQVKNNLKTQNTTTQTTYTTTYHWGVTGSHMETRYSPVEKIRHNVPRYSKVLKKMCSRGNHELNLTFDSVSDIMDFAESAGNGNDVWCDICRCAVKCEWRDSGQTEFDGYYDEKYTEQEASQVSVSDYGNIATQVPTTTTTINWNAIKQALEQQFTPPNQNEYSFVYDNISNEPDLAQIYQSAGGNQQFKIVLRTKQKNDSDFNAWKQSVEQNLRTRQFNASFSQPFQQLQNQTNQLTQERDNARQERDARPTQQDLENERQARNRSRERREQEFNERLESDREVVRDYMDAEQYANVVQNQEEYWQNNHGGGRNN